MQKIIFAAGCFWCYEPLFSSLIGVHSVKSGYSGGDVENPSYEQVCNGNTSHAESVIVEFNESKITLDTLLDVFFEIHDPTTLNRQGNDIGTQYRSAIFFYNEDQKNKIDKKLKELRLNGKFSSPIVTEVKEAKNFFEAEDYHQNFYEKNPNQPYCSFTISPKIKKFKEKFSNIIKS